MIVLVNKNDASAVRNKDIILDWYDMMINKKRALEAVQKYVSPYYVQHNPLIPDGPAALAEYFSQATKTNDRARIVVHKIMAVGDYVFAHVHFLNILNNDPDDLGIAGVDIYRLDADGLAIEHWDTLQPIGTADNAVPWLAPNLSSKNSNGMF